MSYSRFCLFTVSIAVAFIITGCASQGPAPSAAQQRRVAKLGSMAKLPAYYGPKRLIAIAEFANKANYKGKAALGTGMADVLDDALIRTERFIVIERQQIKEVMKEQDFAQSGRTIESSAPQIGKLLNAQILVVGSVVDFTENTSNNQSAFGYGGISLSMAHSEAKVTIAIRLIDTTTGEVLDSQQCKGKAEKNALGLGYTSGDISFKSATLAKTPLGQATQEAIDNAVMFICTRLQSLPWEGRVVEVKGDEVYVNAGEQNGICPGDCFEVYQEGEKMIDPATGLALGAPRKLIGGIEVTSVQPKFSIATVVKGRGIARKNVLRFVPAFKLKGAQMTARTEPPLPDSPVAAKAREFLAKNDRGDALEELDRGLRTNPTDVAALALKLQIELDLKHYREAAAIATRVAPLCAQNPSILQIAAQAQFFAGDYAGSIATLNGIIQKDPNNVNALVLRSDAEAEAGDNAASTRDMRRAINLGYQARK